MLILDPGVDTAGATGISEVERSVSATVEVVNSTNSGSQMKQVFTDTSKPLESEQAESIEICSSKTLNSKLSPSSLS